MNLRARLLMFAIGVSVVGCRAEGDRPPEPEPAAPAWEPPAREPVAEPPPVPPVDRSLGVGLELRRPIVDGRLTLVPIIATRAMREVRYITLEEGLDNGSVEVAEMGDLVVDSLLVYNRSALPLFVLQGELLLGGKQDRVIARSAVIAAGTTNTLSVRCVEHSRSDGGIWFDAGGAIVELSLRRAIAHELQMQVWGEVDAINRRLGLDPPTRTYRLAAAAQAQGENAARRQRIFEQLAHREEHALVVGFAVAIDGELVAIDRFATPALLHQLEPMLLASYVVDAGGPAPARPAPARPAIDPAAIRRFVASLLAVATEASTIVLAERSEADKRASLPETLYRDEE